MTWHKLHGNPTMPFSISLTVSLSIERVIIFWVTLCQASQNCQTSSSAGIAKNIFDCKENILPSTSQVVSLPARLMYGVSTIEN